MAVSQFQISFRPSITCHGASEELGLSVQTERIQLETMPRRPIPTRHRIQMNQLRTTPATNKGNTLKLKARLQPRDNVNPLGERRIITRRCPPKRRLRELLQSRWIMIRQTPSFATRLILGIFKLTHYRIDCRCKARMFGFLGGLSPRKNPERRANNLRRRGAKTRASGGPGGRIPSWRVPSPRARNRRRNGCPGCEGGSRLDWMRAVKPLRW